MVDINLNQNTAQCIKAVENIGSTVYTNICTGTSTVVPWGSSTWFGNIFGITVLSLFILFILGVIGVAAYAIYREFAPRPTLNVNGSRFNPDNVY